MEQIIDIIIKVLATLLALGAGWLGKYLINLLKANLDEKNNARLDLFVTELVTAAEQMFKVDDPDGTARYGYVIEMLSNAGYEITDAIEALIESKVFDINLTNGIVTEKATEEVGEGE